MPTTFNMSDVMISYSRRDKTFVQQLEQSLRATGREIWVDWLDIPPTVDFLQEIYAGIEAANTFVFVISPDSAKSEVCGMEVEHAVKFNKRLIPVLHRNLAEDELAKLHPAVASHNWIYIREQDNFDESLQTLIAGLETDMNHVQMHTKLLVRAREWEREERKGGFLLRGDELKDAEIWLTSGVDRKPETTALQAEYIATSRKAAARTRQIVAGAMSAALVILSVLALFAFQQSGLANDALGVSNQRGTEVAQQVETANAALTQVQDRENARATAQQDAANSLEQANNNATLSGQSALTATSAQSTAGAAQIEAQNNLATATGALALAATAQDQAENVMLTVTVAQGDAQKSLMTATFAQGEGQNALLTAQAAQTNAADAQTDANLAETQAAQQQSAAQTAQAQANIALTQAANANITAVAAQSAASIALTNAANAQATANAAGTRASVALTEAANAKSDASHQQTLAAIAQTEAAIAEATADAANTQAANAIATAEAETQRALSLRLAAEARAALLDGNRPLAIKLGLLANIVVPNPPAESISALNGIATSSGERVTLKNNATSSGIGVTLVEAVGISNDSRRVYASIGTTVYIWDISDPYSSTVYGTATTFDPKTTIGKLTTFCTPVVTPCPPGDAMEGQAAFSLDGTHVLIFREENSTFYLYKDLTTIPQLETQYTFTGSIDVEQLLLLSNDQFLMSATMDSQYEVGWRQLASGNLNLISSPTSNFAKVRNFSIIPGASPNIDDTIIFIWGENINGSRQLDRGTLSGSLSTNLDSLPNWKLAVVAPVETEGSGSLFATDLDTSFGLFQSGRLDQISYIRTGSLDTSPGRVGGVTGNIRLTNAIGSFAKFTAVGYRAVNYDNGIANIVAGQDNSWVIVLDVAPRIDSANVIQSVCQNLYWQLQLTDAQKTQYSITDDMLARLNMLDDPGIACDPAKLPPLTTNITQNILKGVPMTPTYAFPITPTLTPTIDPNAPVTIDSNDAQVSLNGAWQTVENPQANGGSYLISGTADDSMGLIFEGTAISIIYLQHPAMGSFNVEIDGTMMGSVRETGDILLFRQVPITGLTPGLHTLRLIPAQSPIVIDAFVVNPPANWLPGMIVTATLPPTLEITLTPTASWTYSPTPDIVADTLTPSPIIVPTDVVETWTPSPTYIVVTETWTPTPTPSELPTWTPTLETPIWTETPTEIPIETSTSIPVSTTEEVSG